MTRPQGVLIRPHSVVVASGVFCCPANCALSAEWQKYYSTRFRAILPSATVRDTIPNSIVNWILLLLICRVVITIHDTPRNLPLLLSRWFSAAGQIYAERFRECTSNSWYGTAAASLVLMQTLIPVPIIVSLFILTALVLNHFDLRNLYPTAATTFIV